MRRFVHLAHGCPVLQRRVVDNSGSMQKVDGHRFVQTKRRSDVKVVSCSRWNELKETIEYHAQMAAALEAPTTFRMLNDPACGPGSQQFSIAERSLDAHVLREEVDRAVAIMTSAQPGGVTPLVQHLHEIARSLRELEPTLRADGCRVAVILATDGLPPTSGATGARRYSSSSSKPCRLWRACRCGSSCACAPTKNRCVGVISSACPNVPWFM